MPLYQSESKLVMNLAFERKKEIDRRRNLRLLQVRHQSRDFARVIRENLKVEENYRKNKFLDCKKKQLHDKKTEDLKRLQQLYEICLESIGESHREASSQPDLILTRQLEEAENNAKAAQRGAEARKKQTIIDNVEREKNEAPRKIKKATRKKEDLRAHVISSLPKTAINSMLLQKQTSTVIEPEEDRQILKELPSNLARKQLHQINTSSKEDLKSFESPLRQRNFFKKESPYQSPSEEKHKECCCDYVVCWCHQRTSPSSLRKCQSESTLIDSPTEKEEKSYNLYKTLKTRSRSCSPRSVRTLNYCEVGNLYESNQRNFVRVTHHSSLPKTKEDSSINQTVEDPQPFKRVNVEELEKKTSERSARALQKEKLKREWQLLMQEFKQLSRAKVEKNNKLKPQVGIFLRARDVEDKKEAKQKKLIDAFEKCLCSKKIEDTKAQTIGSNLEQLDEKETSLPTLNLAEYQQLDMDDQTCNPSQLTNTMQFSENVINSEFQSQVSQPLSTSAGLQATSEVSTSNERSRAGGVSSSRSAFQQVNSEVSTSNHISRVVENSPPSRLANLQATSEVSTIIQRSRAGGRSPCQSSPSSHSKSGRSRSHRSQSGGRGNSQVTIHTPSNIVHIDVEAKEKSKVHKRKCPKSQYSAPEDSSTSYGSPPQNITPSQKELLVGLINQVSKQALNKELRQFIVQLLSMSRESIDELNVSSGDFSNCSPQHNIKDDLTKLSNLTELYADKVNTLVDIFEEFDEQYSPDQYRSPPPAPYMQNSPNPSPNCVSPQQPPSPSSPCPNIPFSSGLPNPPNLYSPGSSCPFDDFQTPNWELDEQYFTPQATTPCPPPPSQSIPRGNTPARLESPRPATTTPLSHRPPSKPFTSSVARSKSPQIRQTACPPCPSQKSSPCPQKKAAPYKTPPKKQPCMLPPLHQGPCSPTPRQTTPQRTRRPTTPQRTVGPTTPQRTGGPTMPQRTGKLTTSQGQMTPPSTSRGPSPFPQKQQLKNQVQTPFGLSSNLLPHPNEAFQSQPGPSGAQPNFCTPGAVSVPPNFQTIVEESEDSSFDPFCGLPGGVPTSLAPVTNEDWLAAMRRIDPNYQEQDLGEDELDAIAERFERLKRGELPERSRCPPPEDSPCDNGRGPQNFTDDFGGPQNFTDDFGGPQNFTDDFGGPQDFAVDFGTAEFGNEEFGTDINEILQMEAPEEEGVADFPPQTEIFGPGFHWDAANLSEPSWPHSYPYGSVGGHDMSSKHHIAIDSSFDANLVSYPLNSEKLHSIRKKLSDISSDQYRQVIQMLQADCDEDQNVYNKLLRRVASGPFEDPNSTLAPIPHRSPAKPKRSSPHSSGHSSRVSSAFDKSSPHNQPIDNLTSLAILARSLNDSNILNNSKNC